MRLSLKLVVKRFVSTMHCRMSRFAKKKDGKEPQAPKKGKEKGDKEDKTQSPSHSPVPPVKEQKEQEVKIEVNTPEEQKVESEREDWKKMSYCM